jgi:hypothetical protein
MTVRVLGELGAAVAALGGIGQVAVAVVFVVNAWTQARMPGVSAPPPQGSGSCQVGAWPSTPAAAAGQPVGPRSTRGWTAAPTPCSMCSLPLRDKRLDRGSDAMACSALGAGAGEEPR